MQSVSPNSQGVVVHSAEVNDLLVSQVKSSFQAYRQDPTRENRSAYFKSLDDLAKSLAHDPRVFYKDTYIRTAERILAGKVIQAPSAALLLAASAYKQKLTDFEKDLEEDLFSLLKFEELLTAHEKFIDTLTPEYHQATRYRAKAVSFNFPIMLRLFRDIIKKEMEDPLKREEWTQKLKDKDVTVFLDLPKLALCRLISQPDQPIPELVSDSTELHKIQREFSGLDASHQSQLLEMIQGALCASNAKVQELFRQIVQFGSQIQRQDAQAFSVIFQPLLESWN